MLLGAAPVPAPGSWALSGTGAGPAWPAGGGGEAGPAVGAGTGAGRGAPGCVNPRACGLSGLCVSGQAARRAPPAGEVQ